MTSHDRAFMNRIVNKIVEIDGGEAVRTSAGRDIVYVYFDVDDSFMFFVNRRHPVEVTVEVHGAAAPRQRPNYPNANARFAPRSARNCASAGMSSWNLRKDYSPAASSVQGVWPSPK